MAKWYLPDSDRLFLNQGFAVNGLRRGNLGSAIEHIGFGAETQREEEFHRRPDCEALGGGFKREVRRLDRFKSIAERDARADADGPHVATEQRSGAQQKEQ